MPSLSSKDRNLLTNLADKKVKIIEDYEDRNIYLAIPGGDKRRRPVAWINGVTLNRFLASGSLKKEGNDYILSAFGKANPS